MIILEIFNETINDLCGFVRIQNKQKRLARRPDIDEEKKIENALVGFIHLESEDEEKLSAVETKMIKQLKWAARKNETEIIVLHSFAHLSESKANPALIKQLFNNAQERLKNSGYKVYQTPFGYFLDLEFKAPGNSLARIFKNIE